MRWFLGGTIARIARCRFWRASLKRAQYGTKRKGREKVEYTVYSIHKYTVYISIQYTYIQYT